MDLKLPPNAMYGKSQTIPIEKVAILIGENGSGKSCILQSIFEHGLKDSEDYENYRIICSSSGQNENYSQILEQHYAKMDEKSRNFKQICYYFDKSWTKFLIFIAIALRPNGRVSSFLKAQKNFGRKVKNPLKTKISFTLNIDQEYIDSVGSNFIGETNSIAANLAPHEFHIALRNFVNALPNVNCDFSKPLRQHIQMDAEQFAGIQLETGDAEKLGDKKNKSPKLNFDIAFFTQAAFYDRFIDKSSIQLHFDTVHIESGTKRKRNRQLEMDTLSDGEHHLLHNYGLIDLLDSENTLFLLDDVDSHLHYDLNANLWSELHKLDGKVLTTTHQADSIFAKENRIDHIHLVENGKIVKVLHKARKIFERLKILSREHYYRFDLCGIFPKIVLIDGYRDWIIFTALAKRKGLDVSKLSDILVIEKSSGFSDRKELFGKAKFDWSLEFKKNVSDPVTEKIFLICDLDDAKLMRIEDGLEISEREFTKNFGLFKRGKKWKTITRLFVWKRREIENYLLSYSALKKLGLLGKFNNDSVPRNDYLKKFSPCDNKTVAEADVKKLFSKLIEVKGQGFDEGMLGDYVDFVHPDEISDDIEEMFGILVGD